MKEEIEEMLRTHLKYNFSLFKETDKVNVHVINPHDICIGYRTSVDRVRELNRTGKLKDATYFNLEIIDYICYILNIGLEESARGKGIEWSLYESIHNFARNFGSKIVRQTPSGWTFDKKTRMEYLLERGYSRIENNDIELELIL